MRHSIITRILLLLMVSPVSLTAAQSQSKRIARTAQLSGIVTDPDQSRIAKAKVVIKGRRTTRTVVTAADGTYKIDLSPGLYRMTVRSTGFCPMTRAAFEVRSSAAITINVFLADCALGYFMDMKDGHITGARDAYDRPFKEESFFVGSRLSPPLNLLVQFGEKQESRGRIQYKGFKLSGDRRIGVTVTYNLLTVHADSVQLDKKTFRFETEGNTLVEDGNRSIRADKVSVYFREGQPVIQIVQMTYVGPNPALLDERMSILPGHYAPERAH